MTGWVRPATDDELGAWGSPPEGYEVWWHTEEEARWRIATEAERITRKCRAPGCVNSPVGAIDRGYRSAAAGGRRVSWWFYCADHLYGRRVEDGRVISRRLRGVWTIEEAP